MSQVIDMRGKKIGMLQVLDYEPIIQHKGAVWRCRCDCGRETLARGTALRKGEKKSCGCQGRGLGKLKDIRCEFCGEPMVDAKNRFCSKSCAAKARNGAQYVIVDKGFAWTKSMGRLWNCRYQRFVHCEDRNCAKCGWNPEVAKARSEKILESLNGRPE